MPAEETFTVVVRSIRHKVLLEGKERYRTAEILRIVLDMRPDGDYDIRPALYLGKDGSVYAIEMTGVTPKQ